MRISDWSSDVCSSDLDRRPHQLYEVVEGVKPHQRAAEAAWWHVVRMPDDRRKQEGKHEDAVDQVLQVRKAGADQREYDTDPKRVEDDDRQRSETEQQSKPMQVGVDRQGRHHDRKRDQEVERRRSEEHTSDLQSLMR